MGLLFGQGGILSPLDFTDPHRFLQPWNTLGEQFNWAITPSTQTNTQSPWGPQQPYLQDIFQQGQNLYGSTNLVPPMSPYTTQALNAQWNAAQNPQAANALQTGITGLMNQQNTGIPFIQSQLGPQSILAKTASGQFVGQNPYLTAQYNQMAQPLIQDFTKSILPGITSQFSAGGRYGSNAQQEATQRATDVLGRSLANLGTGLGASAYGTERGLQQGAAQSLLGGGGLLSRAEQAQQAGQRSTLGLLPTLQNMQFGNLGLMGNVGQTYDVYNQQQAMEPWQRLGRYGQMVRGNYGGTTTAPGPSPFSQTLGYASQVGQAALPFLLAG